jgi:hypothetical protein
MTPFRITLALVLVMAGVLLAAGCAGQQSAPVTGSAPSITPAQTKTTPVQPSSIANEPKIYTVIQGDPFTYQGIVNDTNIHSVGVLVKGSKYQGSIPMSIPVNANGTFTLGGNSTEQLWDEYTSMLNYSPYNLGVSPYLHICLDYTTTKECFDLLLVKNAMNLTSSGHNMWIHMDPLQDISIPPEEAYDYTGPFFVNGTTNFGVGENLSIELSSLCFLPCAKREATDIGNIGCCGDISSYVEYTKVQGSSSGINTWSVLVNTTPDHFVISRINGRIDDTNRFEVYVTDVNRTANDNGWDSADFVLRVQGNP